MGGRPIEGPKLKSVPGDRNLSKRRRAQVRCGVKPEIQRVLPASRGSAAGIVEVALPPPQGVAVLGDPAFFPDISGQQAGQDGRGEAVHHVGGVWDDVLPVPLQCQKGHARVAQFVGGVFHQGVIRGVGPGRVRWTPGVTLCHHLVCDAGYGQELQAIVRGEGLQGAALDVNGALCAAGFGPAPALEIRDGFRQHPEQVAVFGAIRPPGTEVNQGGMSGHLPMPGFGLAQSGCLQLGPEFWRPRDAFREVRGRWMRSGIRG